MSAAAIGATYTDLRRVHALIMPTLTAIWCFVKTERLSCTARTVRVAMRECFFVTKPLVFEVCFFSFLLGGSKAFLF